MWLAIFQKQPDADQLRLKESEMCAVCLPVCLSVCQRKSKGTNDLPPPPTYQKASTSAIFLQQVQRTILRVCE